MNTNTVRMTFFIKMLGLKVATLFFLADEQIILMMPHKSRIIHVYHSNFAISCFTYCIKAASLF